MDRAIRLLLLVCAYTSLASGAACAQPPESVRVRFAWGGGVATAWTGEIKVEGTALTDSQVLALTADAPSTVLPTNNRLAIRHQIETRYGGVDASLKVTNPDAQVTIELRGASGEKFSQSWPVSEILDGINEAIDGQGNRLSAGRVPGDQIQTNIKRPHLVFKQNENFEFTIAPNRTQFTSQEVRCEIQIPGASSSQAITFSTDAAGSAAPQNVRLALPGSEGVYDIEIRMGPGGIDGFGNRPIFTPGRNQISRCTQVVVLADQSPTQNNTPWTNLQTYASGDLGQSKPIANPNWGLPRLPLGRPRVETYHHGRIKTPANASGESAEVLELLANSWIAIPVSKSTGPQRVTIDYLATPGSNFSVEYLAKDNLHGGGYSSGISVPESPIEFEQDDQPPAQQHQFHIWATENDGWLLISNSDSQTSVQISEVRIDYGPQRLSPQRESDVAGNPERRKQFALFETPDFPARFQAPRRFDSQLSQHLDDWNTFYVGVDRMIQHLRYHGFDGAFVAVAADGSSIYPEASLGSGPRFDSGMFASQACDPIRKDIVEMMMRMFAREGLELVPVINFNSTLPQLEMQRNAAGGHSFDLIDSAGNQSTIQQRLLPIYNPLDRQVQGICNDIARNFSARYSQHASLGGLGITCRPDCCVMLPGSRQAWDQVTRNRFAQTTDMTDPTVAKITAEAMPQWLAWRSSQMLTWYTSLASRTKGQLYLLPVDLYRNAELASLLTPSLHKSEEFSSSMQVVGLDFMGDDNQPLTQADLAKRNIVVAATEQIDPTVSLAQRRVELNVRQTSGANQFFERTAAGALFAHRGKWAQLENIDSLPGLEGVSTRRQQVFTIAASQSNRQFIRAMHQHDSQVWVHGGPVPTSAISEFGLLPAVRFETVAAGPGSPISVRQYSSGDKHWFYVLNDSPWPMEISLTLGAKDNQGSLLQAASSGVAIAPRRLDGQPIAMQSTTNGSVLKFNIEPWSLYAGSSQSATSRNPWHIRSFTSKPLTEQSGTIRKKLYQLQGKLAKAKVAIPLDELQNGSFESFSDPGQSGWDFGSNNQNNFELDSNATDGKTCVTMRSEGQQVWIRSNSIPAPDTGRISVSVWLKVADPTRQPPLRIFLEGKSDGQPFARSGGLGSLAEEQASQVTGQWSRFAIHFDDLPFDLSEFQIGFEMSQTGEITIDNVEVFDRWFDENDSVAITQLLASAGSRLQDGPSINNARKVLESYWVRFLDQHIGTEPKPTPQPKEPTSPAPRIGLPPLPFQSSLQDAAPPIADPIQEKPRRNLFFGRKPRGR